MSGFPFPPSFFWLRFRVFRVLGCRAVLNPHTAVSSPFPCAGCPPGFLVSVLLPGALRDLRSILPLTPHRPLTPHTVISTSRYRRLRPSAPQVAERLSKVCGCLILILFIINAGSSRSGACLKSATHSAPVVQANQAGGVKWQRGNVLSNTDSEVVVC